MIGFVTNVRDIRFQTFYKHFCMDLKLFIEYQLETILIVTVGQPNNIANTSSKAVPKSHVAVFEIACANVHQEIKETLTRYHKSFIRTASMNVSHRQK